VPGTHLDSLDCPFASVSLQLPSVPLRSDCQPPKAAATFFETRERKSEFNREPGYTFIHETWAKEWVAKE
jgi:hypothetical protein